MKKEKVITFVQDVELNLFESSKKYESGSGWPSFFESLPNVFETKTLTI